MYELQDILEKYFTVSSVRDLLLMLTKLDNHTIIDFIKENNFYHQL